MEDEERKAIIERYDRGRENGAVIDDWENPELPLYHTTDRYGFIHDKVLAKLNSDEHRRLQLETERVDKWVKMGKKWDKFKTSDKLRQRVFKGIPDKVRGTFWALFLDLESLKLFQKGKYQEMLSMSRDYSPDVRQIDLDVNRTYRDHINFRERFSTSQKSLFNILCAYSVYNTEVGYCQGMSQIAALLLMYLAEEDAFWALAQLMTHQKYAMHGFFVHGFPKLLRFQAHHDRVLQKMLPRLKKHFDKHGIDSGLYTLKWFFQCFLDRVPFELSLRFWDIYFLEGDRVLICGAYTILKIHSKQLLARKSMDDIIEYIQSRIPENFGMDFDRVIEYYQEYTEDLQRKGLDNAGITGDNEIATKPFGFRPIPAIAPILPPAFEDRNNHSRNTSTSSIGTNLMEHSRSTPTRIKVLPAISPRNLSPVNNSSSRTESPQNPQWTHSPSSSPPVSPRRLRSVSPPLNSSRKSSSPTSSGLLTLRIHVPYASNS